MGFQFGAILALAAIAVGFGATLLFVFKFLRPHFPETDKSSIYECGERPIGQAWFNFNPRFYLIALVFVIFEVDIALTFPVVVVYNKWVRHSAARGWIAFAELLLFTAVLVIGLVWVWAHGDLRWMKKLGQSEAPVPPAAGAASKNVAAR
jgi:NADH-quinone oxidoreductase subunit A